MSSNKVKAFILNNCSPFNNKNIIKYFRSTANLYLLMKLQFVFCGVKRTGRD